MSRHYEKSVQYITAFVKQLVPDATVQQSPAFMDFTFRIDLPDDRVIVRFDISEMDDFEVALERFQNTNYFHTLENRIQISYFYFIGSERVDS